MTGPLDRLFGNGPFGLDRNGKIDAGETAFINEILFSDEESTDVDE